MILVLTKLQLDMNWEGAYEKGAKVPCGYQIFGREICAMMSIASDSRCSDMRVHIRRPRFDSHKVASMPLT